MKKKEIVIPDGPFKGKKIEFAPTTGVNSLRDVANEFMEAIFDFEPGDYLITDESSLYDFTGLEEMEISDILQKIHYAYGLDVSDISSGNLLEIFVRILRQRAGVQG